jgi:hypothetical protein
MIPVPPHRSSLVLQDAIGSQVTVYAQDPAELRALQRAYGKCGYRPAGEVPGGGFQLPYAQHDTFDFSLIGATPWTSPEGDKCVIHDGQVYKQRVLEKVDSRKMQLPEAVKYSRGARNTDPEHVREKAEGEFEYRTLIVFRGKAPVQPDFNLPRGGRHAHALSRPGVAAGEQDPHAQAAD